MKESLKLEYTNHTSGETKSAIFNHDYLNETVLEYQLQEFVRFCTGNINLVLTITDETYTPKKMKK